MKQQPSKLKFKKNHKTAFSFLVLKDQKNFLPIFGRFALKSLEAGKLTFQQMEAARKSIRRNVKKKGSLFIRVFTYKSVTRKPSAVRMGKGKGGHAFWMCPIRKGRILFELSSLSGATCLKAFKRASYKLPFRTKIVKLIF